MIHSTHRFRIRYAETDKMGFVYYGNYAEFFEVGRVELFRNIGISYKKLEDNGLLMPVLDLHVFYHKSIGYDEEISLETTLEKIEGLKVFFTYKIYNAEKKLCTTASTTLLFIDKNSHRPIPIPDVVIEKIKANQNS